MVAMPMIHEKLLVVGCGRFEILRYAACRHIRAQSVAEKCFFCKDSIAGQVRNLSYGWVGWKTCLRESQNGFRHDMLGLR